MIRHIRQACAASLVLLSLAAWAVESGQPLTVGLPMIEPYAYRQRNEVIGIYIDLIRSVMEHMHVTCVFRLLPAARTAHETAMGHFDVSITTEAFNSYTGTVQYTHVPLNRYRLALMGRKEIALPKNRIYSIGAIRGFSTEILGAAESNVKYVNSRNQLLKMLFANRVDFIIGEESITNAYALQHGFPQPVNLSPLESKSAYVVFSKLTLGDNAQKLSKRFDTSLKAIIEAGVRSAIIKKYAGKLGVYAAQK